jgi:hypothetical protein
VAAVHLLIPSYNCSEWIDRTLDSVAFQTRKPDRVVVIDDCSEEEGYSDRVATLCSERGYRFHRNTHRRWALDNIYQGVWRLEPELEDVIFILDGDDFLPPHAIERIAEVYEDPSVWLTYGNYEPRPTNTGQTLAKPYPPQVVAERSFRSHPPFFNHPLTFRHLLWSQLPVSQLQDDRGEFFLGGYDFAIMIPLLEMAAPNHFRFLDETLYYYNAVNPISDSTVNPHHCHDTGRIVQSRPKLDPPPWSTVGILDHDDRRPYALTETYRLGDDWLATCESIEDWGCGRGWFGKYFRTQPGVYRGLDVGVDSVAGVNPFADEIVDLRTYRSKVPGIFMRHVLEHNYDWRQVLANAVASFTERMFLVIFTPWSTTGQTEILKVNDDPLYDEPNPTLSFDRDELLALIGPDVKVEVQELETGTEFGVEHVLRLSK